MKNLKIFLFLLFLLFIYTLLAGFSYTNAVCTDISQNVLRLHVIANSNSSDDQNLKYIVRDSILNYINKLSIGCTNKEEITVIVSNHMEEIQNIAQEIVYSEGYDYPVNIELGNFSFPTKEYGDIKFPPGYYDALRVKIGNAAGKNWWCVMFPPLCFIDVTSGIVPDESKELMQENLSKEEFALLSGESNETKLKFKVVEVLQNISMSDIFM